MSSVRGTLRRWVKGRVGVWFHPSFRVPIAGVEARAGIDPRRAESVLAWALHQDVVAAGDVFEAPEVGFGPLRRVHTDAWLERLDDRRVVARVITCDERIVPVAPMMEFWRRGVGASVDGFAWALAHRARAVSLNGGFHHAWPDRGAGFCALNDVAVAISEARLAGFEGRVAIIDLDAHPPDGIAACLAGDERVHILSLAAEGAWDEVPGIVDTRLPAGTTDAAYLAALDALLAACPPCDALIYLAGADPLVGDRFGALAVSEAGLRERDRRVFHHFPSVPALVLPAGGYTPAAWRVYAGTLAEAAHASVVVAPQYDPLLYRTRQIARQLDPHTLAGTTEGWLDDADLALTLGQAPAAETRFLGHYTAPGIEYALTRFGLLDALARMGFEGVLIEVRAGAMPHQLWVTAEVNGERARLVDLSLSFRTIHDYKTLFVEWLAMQDPRAPFSPNRPKLPGQEAPGLGLAAEASELLIRIAERLGLAGVGLVPAHYHIAWILRDRYVVVDPVERGRFMAMCQHLRGLPLGAASRLLAERGLDTEVGERIFWTPVHMVLPLDAGLKARLHEEDTAAQQVASGVAERLMPLSDEPL